MNSSIGPPRELGADKIAVAHHMDDQAESIMLHLIRGSGLKGLMGMEPAYGDIIRPLLWARRREIEEYAAAERPELLHRQHQPRAGRQPEQDTPRPYPLHSG